MRLSLPAFTWLNCLLTTVYSLIGHLITDSDFPNFHAYHCIIHQQTLCSKMKHEELDLLMKAVVKIVNFVRANALNHRQFRALLSGYESNYTDLILYTDVRWLSRGTVLTIVNNVIEELKVFLREERKDDLLVHLESPVFLCRLAFLADVTHHLNTLSLKLRGRHKYFQLWWMKKMSLRQSWVYLQDS